MSDRRRINWEMLMVLLSIYNCVFLPFDLSFKVESLPTGVVDLIIDLIFLIDIYLNLHTSFIDLKTGELVTDTKEIFKNYLKDGRLIVDTLTCLPYTLITLLLGDYVVISLVKMLKLTRIHRLGKVVYFTRVKEDNRAWINILRLLMFLLLYIHVLACSWYFLVSLKQTWTPSIYISSEDFYSDNSLSLYLYSFFAAISTLIQFEVSPSCLSEIAFCAILNILGSLLISYLLGEITLLVSRLNKKTQAFDSRMDSINTVMKTLKLPPALQLSVTQYFVSTYHEFLKYNEWKYIKRLLSPSWIRKINKYLYQDILKAHPLFSEYPQVIETIVKKLNFSFLLSERELITEGEPSSFFCVIVKGTFEVWVHTVDNKYTMVRELKPGDYCGEIGLLYGVKRTATVRALHYCSVGLLNKATFEELLEMCPDLEESFKVRTAFYTDPYKIEVFVSFM